MAKKTPHEIVYARIAPEVKHALEEYADDENRSVSNMIETILRKHLEEAGKLPKELALTSLVTDRASNNTEVGVDALASALLV